MSIQINDNCPHFVLKDQYGSDFLVSDQIGQKNLVIFFYPKDDTPGCTKEACSFRDMHDDFLDNDCIVIGISSDSTLSHLKFSEKHKLPYTLLSDPQKKVRKLFGVPSNLFGLIPGRVTYIIDKKGTVKGIYNSLTNPLGHIQDALQKLDELKD